MKLDVLAFGAHPDDTELCCSATLAKLVKQGKKIGVVDLTRGEMGTRGTPENRLLEAKEAADILGLSVRENLGLPDTRLENSREHQLLIIAVLRKYKPDVCIITAPKDRHPDHGNATLLLTDALFYSGLQMMTTINEDGTPQAPWRPHHILHYMQDTPFEPDFIMDVTDTFDLKLKAILAFKSQFNVVEKDDQPETYISSTSFFDGMKARGRYFGQRIGVEYGEPFKYAHDAIPLSSFDLFLENPVRR